MNLIDHFSQSAKNYLSFANKSPVYPAQSSIEQLQKFNVPLQENPIEAKEVIRLLDEIGSPATVKSTGGRYFGFVTGGSLPAAMTAKLLVTVWDQNVALYVMSPIAAVLEEISSKWLLSLLELPEQCGVGFVTGATMANFTALASARHYLLKKEGWDVEAKGLFNAPEITVIVGEEVHVSLLKALSLVGFGTDRVIRVPVDDQGRILANKIPLPVTPTIMCVQAGNVNTGSFDPIDEIHDRLKEYPVWMHVDGAFGLWAGASPQKKFLLRAIDLADSWATDAHKWLNVSYDSGLVFVKNKENLIAAMSASASYLPEEGLRQPSHYVPEMSRSARGVEIWAALKSLGRKGLADLIDRNCRYAQQFADQLKKAGFSILNDVVLNQVLVSFGDDMNTLRVIRKIQEEGTCWCGGTTWQGKAAMRISVSSWATTDEDVQQSLDAIIKVAHPLSP